MKQKKSPLRDGGGIDCVRLKSCDDLEAGIVWEPVKHQKMDDRTLGWLTYWPIEGSMLWIEGDCVGEKFE